MKQMKICRTFIIVAFLAQTSCTTEDAGTSDTTTSESLAGTWVSTSVENTYNETTQLSYTNTVLSTYYITESETDLQIIDCEKYNVPLYTPFRLTWQADRLEFLDIEETPFSVISANELSRTYELTHRDETTLYTQTLTKTSSTLDLSRGSLQLSGNITANNNDHVCLYQRFGETPEQGAMQQITIPFDDDIMTLVLGISEPLTVGSYQYDVSQASHSPILYTFDVISNSAAFFNALGTNLLYPEVADLVISASQDDLIEGEFFFDGLDGGRYSGTFSIIPY